MIKVNRSRRLLGLALGCWMLMHLDARAFDTIRVRVFADAATQEATLRSTSSPLTLFTSAGGRRLVQLPAGLPLSVRASGNELVLRWDGGGGRADSLYVAGGAGALIEVDAGTGDPRSYRGAVSVHPPVDADDRLLLVNQIDIEDYVAAVLPSEYPFRAIEGVKAQAVVIRTYALGAHRKYGDRYDLVDTEMSQVYHGADRETDLSRRAVRETAGEVLRYGNGLIEALYSSQCGGHSADNESLWNTLPKPYLRGKPDPFETDTPDQTWSVELDREKLLRALSRRYGVEATGVRIEAQGRDGRVRKVRLEGGHNRIIAGTAFQSTVNRTFGRRTLKSTYFSLQADRRTVRIEGRGFGHGVGLCQYGTNARARAGQSYQEILGFYYSGVTIDDRPLAPSQVAPPVSTEPPLLASSTEPMRIRARRTTGWASRIRPETRETNAPANPWGERLHDADSDTPARRIGW